MAAKFKKGDKVIVITGSDKGKTGNILSVIPAENRVLVSGVNIATMHKKPTGDQPGKIVKVEKTIHISNIAHVEDDKPVRVGFKIEKKEDGTSEKYRVSKKTDKKIG